MSYNSGLTTASLTGTITTTPPTYLQLAWKGIIAVSYSAAVPVGKKWIVKGYNLTADTGSYAYVGIDNGAGTLIARFGNVQPIATYEGGFTASGNGECVAILTAGQRFVYRSTNTDNGGTVIYIEVDA